MCILLCREEKIPPDKALTVSSKAKSRSDIDNLKFGLRWIFLCKGLIRMNNDYGAVICSFYFNYFVPFYKMQITDEYANSIWFGWDLIVLHYLLVNWTGCVTLHRLSNINQFSILPVSLTIWLMFPTFLLPSWFGIIEIQHLTAWIFMETLGHPVTCLYS